MIYLWLMSLFHPFSYSEIQASKIHPRILLAGVDGARTNVLEVVREASKMMIVEPTGAILVIASVV